VECRHYLHFTTKIRRLVTLSCHVKSTKWAGRSEFVYDDKWPKRNSRMGCRVSDGRANAENVI